MPTEAGYCDLHCHLLHGLDDGAKTLADTLEMARALVDLGFTTVAPSPHNRAEYASREVSLSRLAEVAEALTREKIPLTLEPNSENFFLDEALLSNVGTDRARLLGAGGYMLVEAPYTSPVPALMELIFRLKLKAITPLIAHPERCLEFERKGRAAEAVNAGARLQLDIGALLGRYGPMAKRLSRQFLDDGLYSVGATDLHAPHAAREWLGKALRELESRAGAAVLKNLMETQPRLILRGEPVEIGP